MGRFTISCSVAVLTVTAVIADETKKSIPWKGTPHAIPGLIEAEHYDEGPAGVAYHDVDEENQGAPYRKDTQVDIEERSDASNGYGVGWTREKEWLMYTVDVKADGNVRHRNAGGVQRTGWRVSSGSKRRRHFRLD